MLSVLGGASICPTAQWASWKNVSDMSQMPVKGGHEHCQVTPYQYGLLVLACQTPPSHEENADVKPEEQK